MKLNHITLAAFMAVFALPAAFAQGATGGPQSPTREEVQAEAIRSHRDGTMMHDEAGPKAKALKSTKTRKDVVAEAISSHKDGTMMHGEAAPKSAAFKSTRTRQEVTAEAMRSHMDGTMVHSEVTPVAPPLK